MQPLGQAVLPAVSGTKIALFFEFGRDRMGVLAGGDAFHEGVGVGIDDAQNRAGREVARRGIVLVGARIVPDLVLAAELVDHLDHLLGRHVDDHGGGDGKLGRAGLRAGAATHDHLGAGAVRQAERHAIVDRDQLHHLQGLGIDDREPAVLLVFLPDRHRGVEHAGLFHIERLVDAVAGVRHLDLRHDGMVGLGRDQGYVGRPVGIVADQHQAVLGVDAELIGALLAAGGDGGEDLGRIGGDVDDLDGAVAVGGPKLLLLGIEGDAVGAAERDHGLLVGIELEADEAADPPHIGEVAAVENVDPGIRAVGDIVASGLRIDIADIELLELVARYVDDGDAVEAGRIGAGPHRRDRTGGQNRDSPHSLGHDHSPWRSRGCGPGLLIAPVPRRPRSDYLKRYREMEAGSGRHDSNRGGCPEAG